MRSSSNNNIAEKCLGVPGSTETCQGKTYKKTALEKTNFLSTKLISEI